jgi:hypothetical protein
MKAISTKLVASILFAGLAVSTLSATQRTWDAAEKRLHVAHAKRQHSRKDDDIKLNCSGLKKKQTLSGLLATLSPDHPYTIRVSGACQDNVTIINFTDLTLIAEPGASISDASGGLNPVIYVGRTTTFEMQGFTINGQAVWCLDNSTCFFSGNTFQDAADEGVSVDQSSADFIGDTSQHNAGPGFRITDAAVVNMDTVSLINNGGNGAFVGYGSTAVVNNSTVQNNGAQGFRVSTHSLISLGGSNVSNNGQDGVFVLVGSEGLFGGNTITGNGQAGVRVRDLSMVTFPGGSDVTGNLGGTDVVCEGQFGAARDTATSINGGTSNCIPE